MRTKDIKDFRKAFWEEMKGVICILDYIGKMSRFTGGVKFSQEIEKAKEKFKEGVKAVDEVLAMYCKEG